jgi:hypothetical protein
MALATAQRLHAMGCWPRSIRGSTALLADSFITIGLNPSPIHPKLCCTSQVKGAPVCADKSSF